MPDPREVLDPRWKALERERQSLIWDVRFAEYTGPHALEEKETLRKWEADYAEEYNALKPWYAPAIRVRDTHEAHARRMVERFKEKQRP